MVPYRRPHQQQLSPHIHPLHTTWSHLRHHTITHSRTTRFVTLSFLLGLLVGRVLPKSNRHRHLAPTSPLPLVTNSAFATSRLIPSDLLFQQSRTPQTDNETRTFAFVFSTGRSGTQHLSLILRPRPDKKPQTYITHQQEHSHLPPRKIVTRYYRRLAATTPSEAFASHMRHYITSAKLPFYHHLLTTHSATHLLYTGHLPAAFGVLPPLISLLPPGSVRLLRLRRDRLATATSLMALGPSSQDPWTSAETPDNRRWFPSPFDAHVRLEARSVWHRLNRLQRWLWYVDDIECRWQVLKRSTPPRFSFLETSLDALHILDGGAALSNMANFLGVDVDKSVAFARHNSIQTKNRTRVTVSEALLRRWDEQYRSLVGPCTLPDGTHIDWHPSNTEQ